MKRTVMKWKWRFNVRHPYHAVCLGTTYCLRGQVYDSCCSSHQDVYDKRAARRLRKARREIIKRRRQERP